MYREILPAIGTNLVDTFWVFSGNKNVERFKVLPDGCADIIFDLTNNDAFVSGVMTTFQFNVLAGHSEILGVRFKAETFSRITKIPLFELKNRRVDLAEVLPNYNANTIDQLSCCSDDFKKIALLQKLVSFTASKLNKPKDKLIFSIAEAIRRSNGIISIRNLAKENYISLRQLERRFKMNLGLTMKEFSRVIRFVESRKLIAQQNEKSLFEIAFDMGFYDHAHMINEFKSMSGAHPSHFR